MRNRSEPWFAPGAQDRAKYDATGYPAWLDESIGLLERDEMFVPLPDVIAHLVFAMAKDDVGARITLTRLESAFDGINDFTPPVLVHDRGLRVDYINFNLGMAVVTDESHSRVFQIRLDAVTQIDADTQPLTLDAEKVPTLVPTTLSSPGWEKTPV